MSTFFFLAVLLSFFLVGAIILISTIRKARRRRRPVEDLSYLLQNVNQYKQDLELALDPRRQESVKAEWLNDICHSEVCYRRDVLRMLDLLAEYFWRMRRNCAALLQTAEGRRCHLRKLHECRRKEARWKMDQMAEVVDALAVEALKVETAAGLRLVLQSCGKFLKSVKCSARNRESVSVRLQDLTQSWRQSLAILRAELRGNEDAEAMLNELADGMDEALAAFTGLSEDFDAYLKLSEFTAACSQFLRVVRWPLAQVAFWNHVPLDRLRFIRVPTLSNFGRSGRVSVLKVYQQMKSRGVETMALLYPGAMVIAQRIESTM